MRANSMSLPSPLAGRSTMGAFDRPKSSGRRAARLRRDGITAHASYRWVPLQFSRDDFPLRLFRQVRSKRRERRLDALAAGNGWLAAVAPKIPRQAPAEAASSASRRHEQLQEANHGSFGNCDRPSLLSDFSRKIIGSVSPLRASSIILVAIISLVTSERPETSRALQTSSNAVLMPEMTSGPNTASLRNGLIGTTWSSLSESSCRPRGPHDCALCDGMVSVMYITKLCDALLFYVYVLGR